MANPQIPQKKQMPPIQQKPVTQAPQESATEETKTDTPSESVTQSAIPENETPQETTPKEEVSETVTVPAASDVPEGAERAVAIVQHYINEYTAIVSKPIVMSDQLAKAASILKDIFDFVYTQEHGEHTYPVILDWMRAEKDGLMSERCGLRGVESLSPDEWTRTSMLYVVYRTDALNIERKIGRGQLEQALKSSAAYQRLQQIRKR